MIDLARAGKTEDSQLFRHAISKSDVEEALRQQASSEFRRHA